MKFSHKLHMHTLVEITEIYIWWYVYDRYFSRKCNICLRSNYSLLQRSVLLPARDTIATLMYVHVCMICGTCTVCVCIVYVVPHIIYNLYIYNIYIGTHTVYDALYTMHRTINRTVY